MVASESFLSLAAQQTLLVLGVNPFGDATGGETSTAWLPTVLLFDVVVFIKKGDWLPCLSRCNKVIRSIRHSRVTNEIPPP